MKLTQTSLIKELRFPATNGGYSVATGTSATAKIITQPTS
jgi:hypothetical protein